MKEIRNKTVAMLKENQNLLDVKKTTIGIDAFIDKIVRVVHSKDDNQNYSFFTDMDQFGKHISSKSGMSCGIEICQRFTKLGGNSPIMSNALGSLGAKVNCISALGYPDIDPVFKELSSNCSLYTIGNPGYTTALEFDDGKIMLSQRDYLNKITWESLKEKIGLDTLREFFSSSNLIGLVNWTGMLNFNEIYRGILDEIFQGSQVNKERILFFDMCDFSERTHKDVREAVKLINEFNNYSSVIFGLNENEAILLYQALFPGKEVPSLKELGKYMYDNLKVDYLVIHTLTDSLAWYKDEFAQIPSLYVRKPKLSTGGGDNFNAGLCFGFLLGLDLEEALCTANATSGYYVRNAKSPTLDDLIKTIENWDELIESP